MWPDNWGTRIGCEKDYFTWPWRVVHVLCGDVRLGKPKLPDAYWQLMKVASSSVKKERPWSSRGSTPWLWYLYRNGHFKKVFKNFLKFSPVLGSETWHYSNSCPSEGAGPLPSAPDWFLQRFDPSSQLLSLFSTGFVTFLSCSSWLVFFFPWHMQNHVLSPLLEVGFWMVSLRCGHFHTADSSSVCCWMLEWDAGFVNCAVLACCRRWSLICQ